MTERLSHCQGCDDMQPGVKVYRARFRDVRGNLLPWETVRYCGDCADLAGIDWNGQTEAIEITAAHA
jgi:hypothetical protein